MATVSHQTIKLARGKHSSPEHGACVMELASMLAGERFSDHPQSVSRPIAAFLRGYNDLVDESLRQDLYGFASKAVGTAAPQKVEEARARRLVAWADELWERRTPRRIVQRLIWPRATRRRPADPEAAGTYATRAICKVTPQTHREVLALVDELIMLSPDASGRPDVAVSAAGRAQRTAGDRDDVVVVGTG